MHTQLSSGAKQKAMTRSSWGVGMWFAPFEKLGQRRVNTQLQREADGEGHSLLLGWIDANPSHSMRCCQRWTARSVHKANAYDTDDARRTGGETSMAGSCRVHHGIIYGPISKTHYGRQIWLPDFQRPVSALPSTQPSVIPHSHHRTREPYHICCRNSYKRIQTASVQR